MIVVLAALLAVADHPMFQARDAYSSCVTTQAVRLGTGNAETADTILRAVRSICSPQRVAMEQAFPTGTGVASYEAMRTQSLSHWRSDAEDASVAALLEARAKRP